MLRVNCDEDPTKENEGIAGEGGGRVGCGGGSVGYIGQSEICDS